MSNKNDFDTIGDTLYAYKGREINVSVPDTVRWIECGAFENKKIESIIIPEGVVGIGISAFSGCKRLEGIILPSSLTYIDAYAFLDCKSLKTINIPNGVTKLDDHSFDGCKNLMIATIPSSVINIGKGVFANCRYLTIRAPRGSYAEGYARANGIDFEEL